MRILAVRVSMFLGEREMRLEVNEDHKARKSKGVWEEGEKEKWKNEGIERATWGPHVRTPQPLDYNQLQPDMGS